jgi:hypothetical protein
MMEDVDLGNQDFYLSHMEPDVAVSRHVFH